MFSKVKSSRTGKETSTTDAAIKIIKEALINKSITEPIILHYNRAAIFLSKKFNDFINQHSLLQGSTAVEKNPYQNAVIERLNRTLQNNHRKMFNNQLKKVITTRTLDNYLKACVQKMNTARTKLLTSPFNITKGDVSDVIVTPIKNFGATLTTRRLFTFYTPFILSSHRN